MCATLPGFSNFHVKMSLLSSMTWPCVDHKIVRMWDHKRHVTIGKLMPTLNNLVKCQIDSIYAPMYIGGSIYLSLTWCAMVLTCLAVNFASIPPPRTYVIFKSH